MDPEDQRLRDLRITYQRKPTTPGNVYPVLKDVPISGGRTSAWTEPREQWRRGVFWKFLREMVSPEMKTGDHRDEPEKGRWEKILRMKSM